MGSQFSLVDISYYSPSNFMNFIILLEQKTRVLDCDIGKRKNLS